MRQLTISTQMSFTQLVYKQHEQKGDPHGKPEQRAGRFGLRYPTLSARDACISENGMLHWTEGICLNPSKKSNCHRHVYFCFVAVRRHWQTLALMSSLEC